MGTPSAEHHEYDRLLRLIEDGRSWFPPASSTAVPLPLPSPQGGGAPCTASEPPRRRTPAWASAIRGFSNTLCLVILVFLVAPLAMQPTIKDRVFLCVIMSVLAFAFPVLGYVVTWDQP